MVIKKEVRKKELLNIAYELFISKGYEATSVDEIISKAEIAKGTYYYYFESKEQTLEEVINMMINKEVQMAKQILNSKIPIEKKIVGIIMAMRPNIEEMKVKETLNRPENIVMHKKINEKIIDEATPMLAKVVEEGIKTGLFKCNDINERIKIILIISSELIDNMDVLPKHIEIFIDIVEKILGAKKGTMSFIEKLNIG